MKPPEEVARDIARDWLVKAEMDLHACQELRANAALTEVVAFHAQQAGEKALKAFLVWHQVEFPKTHDIERLLSLCSGVDSSLTDTLSGAASLTPYGVEYRYPGEYPPVSAEEADSCVALARAVYGEVTRRLPEQFRR